MVNSIVHAGIRNQVGSNACHKVRNAGYVPGVVYGHNIDTRNIEIDRKEMENVIRSYGDNVLIDLCTNNGRSMTMIKEVQRDPVTGELRHIDFQEIASGQPIHTTVPIRLMGKDLVESNIGIVQQQLRGFDIECLPNRIPESITVDVSLLQPGNPLKVADVEFGEEISILNEPEEIVAALVRADSIKDLEDLVGEDVNEQIPKEVK